MFASVYFFAAGLYTYFDFVDAEPLTTLLLYFLLIKSAIFIWIENLLTQSN